MKTRMPTRFGKQRSVYAYCKEWRRKRSSLKLPGLEVWVLGFAWLILVCALAEGADKLKELQAHFDKESHAGSKIKVLEKLAEAQFEAAGKAGQSGNYVTVGFTFEKYRDNVRAAFDLLKKQEPDADRHPGGYRQLELQVRKGIREIEDTIMVAPGEMRPPLGIVHQDLLDIDDELIRLLFPRRTKDPEKAQPAAGGRP
jgi:hypothetical protein